VPTLFPDVCPVIAYFTSRDGHSWVVESKRKICDIWKKKKKVYKEIGKPYNAYRESIKGKWFCPRHTIEWFPWDEDEEGATSSVAYSWLSAWHPVEQDIRIVTEDEIIETNSVGWKSEIHNHLKPADHSVRQRS